MRVDTVTLEAMRAAIAPLDTPERRARYVARDFPRADMVRDIDARYRWDLFYAARVFPEGLTDARHIDTALRRIVAPLAA